MQSSYRLIWKSRLLPLKMLVSCIICFKGIWEFHALKDLHEGTLHTDRPSFGFPLMYGTYSNKDFFLPFSPCTPRSLCWPWHISPFSFSSPLSSLKAVRCFQCDRTMTSFGRICQDRLTDTWQCCKMTLSEAVLLTYSPRRTKCWQKANTRYKKGNADLRRERGLSSLIVVGSLKLSCNHVWVCFISVKSLTVHC